MPDREHTNHLITEKSPYLLQHAHNPVDWFPWGGEAFAKAKAEDKPVFLSIGYSTCHWCHVMAHESFEDTEAAAALNKNFVCIKVDREEQPDVDAVYMAVCQALTGSGGWPLTILMTPEQKPFWAGTYLPKTARYGRIGLLELLDTVEKQWKTNRTRLIDAGEQITALFRQPHGVAAHATPDKNALHDAFFWFRQAYDSRFGGFGQAPKFPAPHNLLFLLRYSALEHRDEARQMAAHTLEQMFRGGIFDHIGGGFSRYSTDAQWLVPHFEKMLYDNALLTMAYLEAFRQTRRPLFRLVAQRTLGYALRELADPLGGFYCGQDADSDGVEGKYYVFTPDEIHRVFGETDGAAFCAWFGISPDGNFEGKSIPNLLANPQYDAVPSPMEAPCGKLYDYRLARTALHKDDKVLTSWNALMIAALAQAGCILREPLYLEAARKARGFLITHLQKADGRLSLRWRDGESAHDGQLDDYAFYAYALMELYRATFDAADLLQAVRTAAWMLELFFDMENGGFFLYAKDAEQLIHRPKELYDGAIPSGNAVAATVLLRLFRLTGDPKWQQASEKQLSFLAAHSAGYPAGHSAALLAFSEALYPSKELVCVTAGGTLPEETRRFLLENSFPALHVLVKTSENEAALAQAAPFTADYPLPQSGCAHYLCQNGTCTAPVFDLSALRQALETPIA